MDPLEKLAEPPRSRDILLGRLAAALALIGGVLVTLAALLVSASVLGRWLFSKPIQGDYEIVGILVGISIFAFLGYTQARNGHIAVDTFTLRLPDRVNSFIDGLWDLILALFLGFFAWGLWTGGLQKRQYGETLSQVQWEIWPVYIACAVLSALACLIALNVAFVKMRGSK
ncbi:TRAP transporter small permease [Salmonella enterica subsp. enterica]|nr:TRAP transporter small permease [Salmonella enterica subsp. enterica serovar Paratyphi A]